MAIPYLLFGLGFLCILIAAIGTVISNVYDCKCRMCKKRP